MRVPQCLLMHEGMAYLDRDFGPAFRRLREEAGPALDKRLVLCLLLLVERARGAASAWAPYVNVLPTSYSAAPSSSTMLAGQSFAPPFSVLISRGRGLRSNSACAVHAAAAAAAAGARAALHQYGRPTSTCCPPATACATDRSTHHVVQCKHYQWSAAVQQRDREHTALVNMPHEDVFGIVTKMKKVRGNSICLRL